MTAPTTAGQPGDARTALAPTPARPGVTTLSRRTRNALVTVHIAASVALLGDVLGLAAVTIEARDTADPESARALHEIMSTFSLTFGIPSASRPWSPGSPWGSVPAGACCARRGWPPSWC
jgi:hypothetical protein